MKKMLACLFAFVLMLAMICPVLATGVQFVPSISDKGAPEIVFFENEDGEQIIGYVTDPEGNIISEESIKCIVVTPVSQANTSTEIPEDARDILLDVYDELLEKGMKLSDLCPDLDKIVKDKIGEDKDANDMVVRDLFDVSIICDELKHNLDIEGNTIDLTFRLPITGDQPIIAMIYVDGVWRPIETVNNGNGTITCTFDDVCPVAFLTLESYAGGQPATGDTAGLNTLLWAGIMVLSLAAIAILVVVYRRSVAKKASER